jgi:hypothetical protein
LRLDETISRLESIADRCAQDDPVEKFLAESARSYADSARMLSAIGTPEFTRYSTRVFGRPDTIYKNIGVSAVDSAKYFLSVTDALLGNAQLFPSTEGEVTSEDFAGWLKAEVDEFFDHGSSNRSEHVIKSPGGGDADSHPREYRVLSA